MAIATISNWSTAPIPETSRYEAWDDKLNATYGSWASLLPKSRQFTAEMSSVHLGLLSIHECICDPCSGKRKAWNINQDDDFFAIQLVQRGTERVTFDGMDFDLKSGDIFVWDSTRPMTFDVMERLHKVSLVLPLERLRHWLPTQWHSLPRKLSNGTTHGMLLSSLISGINKGANPRDSINDSAILETVVAALVSGVSTETSDVTLKDAQLKRVEDFISRQLQSPELSPTKVAEACKISVRYLHWLFRQRGTTLMNYIVEQRLLRCQRDLLNVSMKSRSISEICYGAGFSNPAHFSRRYKQFFAESPTDTRNRLENTQ
ncbi:MAG: helix-turn-helix domain-containing protein [Gammaproteobacteria bacterium]|jgi:AraC-like DNA-binding protein|nr:helix-turn-helix domain-containing protein [Gammaproteobacteria bacterium]